MWHMNGGHYGWLVGLVMVPLALLAGGWDYRRRRIPNWLNLGLALSGLAVQQTLDPTGGLARSFEGLLAGLGLLMLPWAVGMIGAGDVKLLGGLGAWLGPLLVWRSFVAGALIGGLVGTVMILRAGRVRSAWDNAVAMIVKCAGHATAFGEAGTIRSLGPQAQMLPYGVPLVLGALAVLILELLGG